MHLVCTPTPVATCKALPRTHMQAHQCGHNIALAHETIVCNACHLMRASVSAPVYSILYSCSQAVDLNAAFALSVLPHGSMRQQAKATVVAYSSYGMDHQAAQAGVALLCTATCAAV